MKIYAPFAGTVRLCAADGQVVAAGDIVAVVEAVKLEAPVRAPGPGVVRRVIVEDFVDVCGGDVLLELNAVGTPAASRVQASSVPPATVDQVWKESGMEGSR